MSNSQLSFAQTYILASKVRTKLTKEAQSPKSSLRNLVVQANMLDNIMDYISEETTRRTQEYETIRKQKSVEFAPSPLRSNYKTSITEYEIDEDSDDEEFSDDEYMIEEEDDEEEESDDDEELLNKQQEGDLSSVYYEEEEEDSEGSSFYSDDDSEDDYYIYSDEDIVKEEAIPRSLPITSYHTLPTIDLSLDTITEEEEELPELSQNFSSSEEEEEEELLVLDLNRINLSKGTATKVHNSKKLTTGFEFTSTTTQQQHESQPISLFKNENISLEHVF